MRRTIAALREMTIGPAWPIAALSAMAWSLVGVFDNALLMPGLCSSRWSSGAASLTAAIWTNATAAQALSWLVMLLAMMTPLVWLPLDHVWRNSLHARRARAVALFLGGYFGIWLIAMAGLTLLAIALRIAAGSATAAFAVAACGAVLWQLTPIKLAALRRCHAAAPLPAFGLAAEIGSLRFGAANGSACVGTCWLLMLLPLTSDVDHVAMMATVAAVMLVERYTWPPKPALRPA
jgi:predicted metal-binding membrane protein